MHWTTFLLATLCAACVFLNAAQFKITRSVRTPGIILCASWLIQQAYHYSHDYQDSLILFAACDIALLAYFRKFGRSGWRDEIIEALVIPTFACGVLAKLEGGMTVNIWWLNWSMVAVQMALGLPWGALQMGRERYSHGSIKQAASHG